jgi:hypothetical protein
MSSSKKKQLRKEQYMTERQNAAAKEAKQLKRYTLAFWVAIVLIVAIFVTGLVYNPIKSIIYRNTDAIQVGEYTLSSADANYFYVDAVNTYVNQNSYLLPYLMDTTKPLNEQVRDKETGATWADYFLDAAKDSMKNTYALYSEAVKNGHTLSDTDKNAIDSTITSTSVYAMYYGYSDLDAYLVGMYGTGANEESYRHYLEVVAIASSYLAAYSDSLKFTAEDLAQFQMKEPYKYNSYTFATYYVDSVKYRQGGTKDDKGNTTYSDEERAAAIKAAEEAANLLASGTYADLTAFDNAIKAMPINLKDLTVESKKYEDMLYSQMAQEAGLFHDWLIGKVVSEDKDAEPTFEVRKEGEMTVIPYETGTGDKTEISGYFVVRFESVTLNDFAMKDIRHLLVKFEGGKKDDKGNVTYSDAEKAAAKAEAEKLLAEWEKGDKSETSFAELAKKHSDDNKEAGGLYENVYPGQMVDNFNDWCFDESRKAGDYGIVETEFGYHIMFFVGDTEQTFRDYMITNAKRTADVTKWQEDLANAITLNVLTVKHLSMDLILQPEHE